MGNANRIFLAGEHTDDTRKNSTDSVVLPGDLLEVKSDGTVKRQATAAADCVVLMAQENTVVNKGIDDTYATGDQMSVVYPDNGSKVQVNLASGGAAVVAGDGIESAGGGKCRKLASGTRLFVAETAGNPSAAEVRISATRK